MEKQHILISGERGAGKSTLIQKLLSVCHKPRYGYYTKSSGRDENGRHEIYLYDAAGEDFTPRKECMAGFCDSAGHTAVPEVFDTIGVRYIRAAKAGGIIVMDEIGFFEREAFDFLRAVRDAMDADIPVLAAIKSRRDIPFLEELRAHAKAEVFEITPENRGTLYEEIAESEVFRRVFIA
ncbi:MAG: hypothetical protein IK016_10555 [Lachnospiraceae bacterium]|nr:hypothetical protein [Lachnospiraceae bacterium]